MPTTVEQLIQVLHARPFGPFRLHLADGRDLLVEHPDFVARSPSGSTAIVCKPDETFEIVDLLIVASIEVRDGGPRSPRKRQSDGGSLTAATLVRRGSPGRESTHAR